MERHVQPARRATAGDDGASRERIVIAAARLFREKGYETATMREIAAATGVRSGSLYYHFPAKEDILEEVLERGIGATIRRVRGALAAVADRPFSERLGAAVTEHLNVVNDLEWFSIGSIRAAGLPPGVMQRYGERRREYDALWSTLIAEGVAAGDISAGARHGVVRLLIYGALNWSAEWFQPERSGIDEVARIATAFVLEGLAGVRAHPED